MSEHRYILQKYEGMSTRFDCPSCGKKRVFARYIDTDTGDHLHESVGRCNRESNCGYHYTPKQFFDSEGVQLPIHRTDKKTYTQKLSVDPSFIDVEIFRASMQFFDRSNFAVYLTNLVGKETAKAALFRYNVGSSKYWPGSTVFWQQDVDGNIRSGKIMLYNSESGKRVKQPYNHITWAHKALKIENFNLKQCFFGEHLLAQNNNSPIAIVESEKTAVIASIFLPQFTWLACGSLQNLNKARCATLTTRKVILYPDLNGFVKWQEKAIEMSFGISRVLEDKASEADKTNGLDIADYLVRTNRDTQSLQMLRSLFLEMHEKLAPGIVCQVGETRVGCLKRTVLEILDGFTATIGTDKNLYWQQQVRNIYGVFNLQQ